MKQEHFRRYRQVFWDFDGVIKDSVSVKEEAFVELFAAFGPTVAAKVREHHRGHGGMSRFEKIPFYFRDFAHIEPSAGQLDDALKRFESLVYRKVVDSPWVPGARELILGNPWAQIFYLVTATPREEIERILSELGLTPAFRRVFGSPEEKADAVASVIHSDNLEPESCLMIGDSRADYEAASKNGIDFLAREAPENAIIQGLVSMDFRVKDFRHLVPPQRPENAPVNP